MTRAILILSILAVLLLAACDGVDVSQLSDEDLSRLSDQAVICEAPYMRLGLGCCLDADSNGICDDDEATADSIVCNDPYIQVGVDCCLDKNDNGICDDDESYDDSDDKEDEKDDDKDHDDKIEYKDIDGHFKGDEDAPVTIIEWSDFECPFCERFYDRTFEDIEEEYIETGKVKFVYKHFPLSFHPNAQEAAEASECAADQGAFWEMHDLLFERGVDRGVDDFMDYADYLQLDIAEFEDCLFGREKKEIVEKGVAEGEALGITGTPTFFVNGFKIGGSQPFAVFESAIEKELGTYDDNDDEPTPSGEITGHSKGADDAPIVLVEWGSFECPFCQKFYRETLGTIESNFVENGNVKIIYKHFPLTFHPNAKKAAEASECAADQGAFWEMHDKLFEEGVKGGVESYKTFAVDLGLDSESFNECLDSGEKAKIVQADFDEGVANGITGTPGFLVNGKRISGSQPYAVFEQAFEDIIGLGSGYN